jgi:hypothetical protein
VTFLHHWSADDSEITKMSLIPQFTLKGSGSPAKQEKKTLAEWSIANPNFSEITLLMDICPKQGVQNSVLKQLMSYNLPWMHHA